MWVREDEEVKGTPRARVLTSRSLPPLSHRPTSHLPLPYQCTTKLTRRALSRATHISPMTAGARRRGCPFPYKDVGHLNIATPHLVTATSPHHTIFTAIGLCDHRRIIRDTTFHNFSILLQCLFNAYAPLFSTSQLNSSLHLALSAEFADAFGACSTSAAAR